MKVWIPKIEYKHLVEDILKYPDNQITVYVGLNSKATTKGAMQNIEFEIPDIKRLDWSDNYYVLNESGNWDEHSK